MFELGAKRVPGKVSCQNTKAFGIPSLDVYHEQMNEQVATEPKRPSLFWRLTSWLWPTNRDSLIWLCCSLVLIGLLDPVIEQQLMIFQDRFSCGLTYLALGCIVGALLGVVSTAAWRKHNSRSGKLVVLASLASCISLAYSSYLTWGTFTTHSSGLFATGNAVVPIAVGEGSLMFWFKLFAGVGLAAIVVMILIRAISYFLIQRTSGSERPANGRNYRVKIMIGFAVLMLALGIIQNVFFPNGFFASINFSQWGSSFSQFFAFVAAIVGSIALLFASWLFASGRWNLGKHILLFFLFGLSLFGLLVSSTSIRSSTSIAQIQLATIFGIVFLLWTATVVNDQSRRSPANSEDDTRSYRSQSLRKKWPCIWSVLGMLVTLILAVSFYFYDPVTLVATRDLETARYVRKLARSSKGQIRFGTFLAIGYGGFHDLTCNFEKDVEPDVFGDYSVPGLAAASIEGLTPNIKTHTLSTLQQANLVNSKVSSAQLHDLISNPTAVYLKNVEVVDPDASVVCSASFLQIEITDEARLDSVLRAIKSADSGLVSLKIDKQLDRAELDELVRFSQRVAVPLETKVFQRMVELDYSSELSMRNLSVADEDTNRDFSVPIPVGTNTFTDKKASNFLFTHDISVVVDDPSVDDELFWDVAFIKGKSGALLYFDRIRTIDLEANGSLAKKSKSFGWNFGVNENKEITDLFLPEAESAFDKTTTLSKALGKVETLCFDPYWLSGIYPGDLPRGWQTAEEPKTVLLKGLKLLPNLKRLVLSEKSEIADASFLNSIPKIEHLQVRFLEAISPNLDFRVAKQLKTLVYFGTPPRGVMRSLAKLKNLESVIVVDLDDGTLANPNSVKNLENSIPGVEIKVVLKAKFKSLPTEKFRQHVVKQAETARQRIGVSNAK